MAVWRKNIDTLAQAYAHFNYILNFEDKTFIFSNRQDNEPRSYIGKSCEGEIHILDTLANAEVEAWQHRIQVSDNRTRILTFSDFQVKK